LQTRIKKQKERVKKKRAEMRVLLVEDGRGLTEETNTNLESRGRRIDELDIEIKEEEKHLSELELELRELTVDSETKQIITRNFQAEKEFERERTVFTKLESKLELVRDLVSEGKIEKLKRMVKEGSI